MRESGFTKIQAVIFDVDNTLLATNDFALRGIIKTIQRLNETERLNLVSPSREEIKLVQAKNLPFEDIFKELFPGEIFGKPLVGHVLGSYRVQALELKYEATPGAIEAMAKLAAAGFEVNSFAFMCTPITVFNSLAINYQIWFGIRVR